MYGPRRPFIHPKGGFPVKFKLFSVILLLVCFAFLGVLAGVIPVTGEDAAVPARGAAVSVQPGPTASAAPTDAPEETSAPAGVVPTPRLAGTAAPRSTQVIAGATAQPLPSASASPVPTGTAVPGPTPEASPSSPPSAAPEPVAGKPAANVWHPAAQVISTTITWEREPLQNDTSFDVDGPALLAGEPDITLPALGYQILIIHTHGTEAFTPDGDDQYQATADYRTTDTDHTVIQVGLALGKALEEQGLRVLVDTELYDWPSYNGSYDRSQQAIQQYLEQYPGIAMVIDLHRDAIGDSEVMYRTVSDQLEADAAQIMFVMGTDASLTHPAWRENLALAMSLQRVAEEKYPHLMRPTLLTPYRYNQQLTPGSVLLEIGSAGNTLQEAITAAELFADAVGPVLAQRVGA